jgi:hypothetical protein
VAFLLPCIVNMYFRHIFTSILELYHLYVYLVKIFQNIKLFFDTSRYLYASIHEILIYDINIYLILEYFRLKSLFVFHTTYLYLLYIQINSLFNCFYINTPLHITTYVYLWRCFKNQLNNVRVAL